MEIKEVNITEILPITFDDNITINEDLSLSLNNKINKDIFKLYKKSPFGLLLKDLKRKKYKNINTNYIYINNNDNKILCKLIDENELDKYTTFSINKIKDLYYIIIKNENEIISNKKLIDEIELEELNDNIINTDSLYVPIEDEEAEKQKNIKLFE